MASIVRRIRPACLKKSNVRCIPLLPDEPFIAESGMINSTVHLQGKHLLQFPGIGAHWQGMTRDLLPLVPEITKELADEASAILGRDIIHLINEGSPLDILEFAAPLTVFHSILMWRLICHQTGFDLKEVGAVCGMGIGELTALIISQTLTFHEGFTFVYKQDRICQKVAKYHAKHGKRCSMVELQGVYPREFEGAKGLHCGQTPSTCGVQLNNWGGYSIERAANDDYYVCDLAAIMDHNTIVISGFSQNVSQVITNLQSDPCVAMKQVNYYDVHTAYHSGVMGGAMEEITVLLNKLPIYEPTVPVCLMSHPVPTCDVEMIMMSLRRQVTQGCSWLEVIKGLWWNEPPEAEYWEIGPSKNNRFSKLALQNLNRRIITRTFSDAEQIRLFWKQKKRKAERGKRRPLLKTSKTINLREPTRAVAR